MVIGLQTGSGVRGGGGRTGGGNIRVGDSRIHIVRSKLFKGVAFLISVRSHDKISGVFGFIQALLRI